MPDVEVRWQNERWTILVDGKPRGGHKTKPSAVAAAASTANALGTQVIVYRKDGSLELT